MTDIQSMVETLQGGGFNPELVRFLVYGESGVGKTRFASTWPNCFFIDLEKGMASVRTTVDRVQTDDWDVVVEVFKALRRDCPYDTIVIDSLNELQKIIMANIMKKFPNVRRSYDNTPQVGDYGKMLNDFNEVIRRFMSLPTHLVLIAQVQSQVYETDLVKPQLTGKNASGDVCRLMDCVGYLHKIDDEDSTRALAFDATRFVSKDRSDLLPKTIFNPTFESLAESWTEANLSL